MNISYTNFRHYFIVEVINPRLIKLGEISGLIGGMYSPDYIDHAKSNALIEFNQYSQSLKDDLFYTQELTGELKSKILNYMHEGTRLLTLLLCEECLYCNVHKEEVINLFNAQYVLTIDQLKNIIGPITC